MNDKLTYTNRSNIVRMTVGIGLILLGILFLVGRYVGARFDIDFGHYTWPFFIITPGVFLFLISFTPEPRPGIILAVVGAMLTTIGTILLIQNAFDLFASWAYAWALVAPTSIGLAKLVYGGIRGLRDQVKSGVRLAGIGLAIFVFGAFFFELAIGLNGFRFGAAWLCWPALLIGLGIALLLSNLLPRRNRLSLEKQEDASEKRNE
jgi:hypothetical protein